MKNKKWLWIGLGAAVLVLLVAVSVIRGGRRGVTSVQFARVRVEDITSRVRAPGKIEPRTQAKISADIMGKIVRLPVKEGDHVKSGQLLLQLDDTQYRALHGQSLATLSGARSHQRDAEQALRMAESNYTRQKALWEQKLLSQAEWDVASQAALDGSRDNLGKCSFIAPFDGVVSALNVEQGEIVITGTMNNPGTQILVVSDLSRMLVKADVDETDVVDIRLGQKAKITVDALPDTSFVGTVVEVGNTAKRSITSTVEGQTNFEVKVVFDDNVPAVRPGMTADVEVATATHTKTRGVPIQAVVVRTERDLQKPSKKARAARKQSGGETAFAAEDDTVGRKDKEITGVFVVRQGVASFVPVRTGISSETDIEVTGEGLKGTDVVVAGPYKALRELKPGSKVKQEQGGPKGRK